MTIQNMAFVPMDGLRNKSSYPTDPVTEDTLRDNVQEGMDQLRDYINNTLIQNLGNGVSVSASGLTGATQASRYVGATTSGAPTTGTFLVGDFVIDRSAMVWICNNAGTPGTWKAAGVIPVSGGSKVQSGSASATTSTSGTNIFIGTVTFPTAFATAPVVVACINSNFAIVSAIAAISPVTTGFSVNVNAGQSGQTFSYSWIAIGS